MFLLGFNDSGEVVDVVVGRVEPIDVDCGEILCFIVVEGRDDSGDGGCCR
jgi:hypothetical protein